MAVAASFASRVGAAGETYQTARAIKPKAPKVKVRSNNGATRPVVTAMVVVVGIGFLNAWLVEKKTLPERRFFVRMAILGFVLSLLAEATPGLGKGMAYLVMTATVFERSQDILRALQESEAPKPRAGPEPSPFNEPGRPVTLYVRSGPMPSEPNVPARPRLKRRPQRGAAFQT